MTAAAAAGAAEALVSTVSGGKPGRHAAILARVLSAAGLSSCGRATLTRRPASSIRAWPPQPLPARDTNELTASDTSR